MFRCLNNSNKENIITIQGARATDSINPFASIVFQNFDRDTSLTYNMASISCIDHYGDTSNNGSGDLILKTSYTGGSNLQERMRILFNGNVLIGADVSTEFKLNVGGGIQALGYCNLLSDSTSNTSIHKAPTCRALNTVAEMATYASNALISNNSLSTTDEWSSNTAAWASNTAQTALDASVFGSNLLLDIYWASNIAIPWMSNVAVFSSNTSVWASNDASIASNVAFYSSNTAVWASNTAQSAYDASMFASNTIMTSFWSSNTATFASNTSIWLSNDALPWSCNAAIFASNTSVSLSNSVIPQINNLSIVASNTNITTSWLSNTAFPTVSNMSMYASNTVFWLSNSILPPLSNSVAFSSNATYWLSNTKLPSVGDTADYASNTSAWLSNYLVEPSVLAFNTSLWLSNTSLPFTCNNAMYASNTSFWLSNTVYPLTTDTLSWTSNVSLYTSNISYWVSNNILPTLTSNVDFGSNTSSWLSNISIPITSNIAVFSSNTSSWLSNIGLPWSCNTSVYGSNTVYFLSNTSVPWTSNASVYSSNTSYWLSNTVIPTTSSTSEFGSNTSSWLSNISIPIASNIAVYGSNTSYWLSNTALPSVSNIAVYGSNTSYWLSNTAIVWSSNTAIAASNRAFASWSNSAGNVYIGSGSNVGIGTTTPTATLDVQGTSKTLILLTNELQVVGSSTKPIDNLIALKSLNPTIMDASLSNTASVYGGGPGAIYDSNIEAWRFVNDSNTKKITWYFFGNSNANNTLYRYKNLRTAYYKIRFNGSNIPNSDFWPQFSIYSLPLGDGNDAAAWYRARMNYFTYTSSNVQLGKDYCFYINEDPTTAGFLNIVCDRKIKVHFSSNQFSAFVGPSNETRIQDTNVLEYITLQTNSSALINTVDFTMTEVGFRFGTEITRFVTCFSSN